MATCNDCLCLSRCKDMYEAFCIHIDLENSTPCKDFKNKADFVEVKYARWIEESSLYVHCSNCKTREYPREHNFKSKVCPNCGAKMDSKPQKGGEK